VNSQIYICESAAIRNWKAASLNLLNENDAMLSIRRKSADKELIAFFLKPLANPLPTKSKFEGDQHDRFMQSGKDYYYTHTPNPIPLKR
jgi:hypothetical protein